MPTAGPGQARPIGWVTAGRPYLALRPVGRPHVELAADVVTPPVALIHRGVRSAAQKLTLTGSAEDCRVTCPGD